MAIEYTFYGEADVSSDDLRSVIVGAVGGAQGADGTVLRTGLNVTANRVDAGGGNPATHFFGFEHRVTATFRFSNTAEGGTRDHNITLMVGAVLAYFDRYAGRGVLLFNGEEVIIQRLDHEVVFNSDWDDWTDVDEVRPLLSGHAVRPLLQPLL